MKGIIAGLAGLALLLVAGASVAQFGGVKVPSSGAPAEHAVKKAASKGVEAAINDKLAKKGCAFTNSTTENQTTCNLDQIVSDLQGWRSGLESTIANKVDIYVKASANNSDLAWKRVSYVQDKLRAKINYWHWYTQKTTDNGDKLKIWVTVD